ncbi:MAG: hypothetical protein ABIU54_08235 [Candidatus Eisenbacteria bacterium]
MSPSIRFGPSRLLGLLLLLITFAPVRGALAASSEYLSVTDPLQREFRILELYSTWPQGMVTLPTTGTLPLRRNALTHAGESFGASASPRLISVTRIERDLSRGSLEPWKGATPRAWQYREGERERLELSLGLEGEGELSSPLRDSHLRWADGSGAHVRIAAQVERWLAYSHLWAGQLHGAERFTDALAKGTDVALQTEESYLAYDGGARSGLMFGRNRWHWGPGDEGSLLISRTSAPMSGLMLHLRFESLRLDATALHATLEAGSGEQLAAHRLEWQVRDGLRLGATETARYRSSGYQGAYLVSVIPFTLVQRLLDQDAGVDTTGALRNNILLGLDAAWRVADGTRVYGELLIDDLHAESGDIPNKLGYQVGAEGVGDLQGTRLSWGSEWTRLSRFVYTSFYGRVHAAQGAPIGFPTGPDSERLRVRVAWDPNPDWQVGFAAARTTRGQSTLADAFIPGSAVPGTWTFAGTPERSRRVDGLIRWWPASGVDVSARIARTWRTGAEHVAGRSDARWDVGVAARLTR